VAQLFSELIIIKNMFLKHQISILELFLKDHVTLKTGIKMLKFQLCHHRNKVKKYCILQ